MRKISLLILTLMFVTGCDVQNSDSQEGILENKIETQQTTNVELDLYTLNKLNALLQKRSEINDHEKGALIDFFSKAFLGTPYKANMLQGSEKIPEKLIIDFRGLDCFTYLDYVEALRKSKSPKEFINNVIKTRYIKGKVHFLNRKHFFTDWAYREYKRATDITAEISPHAISVEKYLNKKADNGNYLPGLPVIKRTITYIPSNFINEEVISRLKSGDFIGIYTKLAGLDVTHVGFFIMTDKGPMLRNASSRKENEKVVDSPFMDYVAKIPGIIVLRAL
ncbi:DUF1460 domain-containing protein [Bartonella krasnovii]|uniref:DUF1460 domain-containing protein n=1 Tax=Bartonella krasnovii TaxID=2267275 RepID=A0A5B9D1R9_9HYPH|nr:DUF1460 domain-containing protein [Bartonella krasnovii]QEE12503.1 DUF1460 domain-containing protein [Bartonella krasnovii]UNF28596.1 DUF1460 domain-containing protein [Bartonella krasnovii]UNF34974.1 DUF1460 domain-containing protein [Bartonella krasnovii]UNF36611.1 DUF1460 domain-containing protein [Bartonella krasnovii]UNF38244.1 DUF1460 domain-containing protein [Bartonella krasnovii]